MSYAELAPSPALGSLVACSWAFSGPGSAQHRILPDGCIDIVVRGERARVVGTMQQAVVVPIQPGAVLGVRLRPGEAARLFPAVPRELTDSDAALDEVWGDDGRMLEDSLLALLEHATREALSAAEILRRSAAAIEHMLRRRLAAHATAVDLRVRAAAALLERGIAVREAAEHVAISERQLGRRFAERVGLNPKTFARVRRLQRAAELLANGTPPGQVAALAGYGDQAHFTHEATALAGTTPGALQRELADPSQTAIPVTL
jgi:AraC-like DNA-binding protein